MIYLIKSSLLLIALYGCFALLLSRETFHRLNRICLLGILVASLVLPLVEITMDVPWTRSTDVQQEMFQPAAVAVDEQVPMVDEMEFAVPAKTTFARKISWSDLLWAVYLTGFLLSLGFILWQVVQLRRELRGGVQIRDEYGNTIVIHGGDFAPHSFLHHIIICTRDYEALRRPILAHEQAHIRMGHSWDILLLLAVQTIQWFNPFVWLLGRDLRAVHEYEADNAVLNQGIDAKTYQLLLVTKAVGNRLQTLSNSLRHGSLKKRIMMMHKMNSNKWRMVRVALLPVLMAVAVMAWAKAPERHDASAEAPEVRLPSSIKVKPSGTTDAQAQSDKMVQVFRFKVSDNPRLKEIQDGFAIRWGRGTWVQKDDNSFVEERPICKLPGFFPAKSTTIKLDGEEFDIDHAPDLPFTALKKVEIRYAADGHATVNLITKPVQIPADVKGNINPELTILLTGTPPKDSGAKTSIWVREDIHDGFSWKNYTITSWKWDNGEDISDYLEDVAIRKDHHVRVNVLRGVPQQHIDRLKGIMRECGITKVEFVKQ